MLLRAAAGALRSGAHALPGAPGDGRERNALQCRPGDAGGPSAVPTPSPAAAGTPRPSAAESASPASPTPAPTPVSTPEVRPAALPGALELSGIPAFGRLGCGGLERPAAEDQAILEVCREVIETVVPADGSDYEKELAVHDWMLAHGSYDSNTLRPAPDFQENPNNDNPYGFLVGGKGICLGYTTTFQLLMDLLEIPMHHGGGQRLPRHGGTRLEPGTAGRGVVLRGCDLGTIPAPTGPSRSARPTAILM